MTDPIRPTDSAMNRMTMTWDELRNWIRLWGPEIRQLAERGDKTSQRIHNIICEMYHKQPPLDHPLHAELRQRLTDYLHRDLTASDRVELGGKFGHLVPEEQGPAPTRIFVPGPERKQ